MSFLIVLGVLILIILLIALFLMHKILISLDGVGKNIVTYGKKATKKIAKKPDVNIQELVETLADKIENK